MSRRTRRSKRSLASVALAGLLALHAPVCVFVCSGVAEPAPETEVASLPPCHEAPTESGSGPADPSSSECAGCQDAVVIAAKNLDSAPALLAVIALPEGPVRRALEARRSVTAHARAGPRPRDVLQETSILIV